MDSKARYQPGDRLIVDADLRLDGIVFQQAPVVGEGTVAGSPFLFRARGGAWAFAVSSDPAVDVTDVLFSDEKRGFFRTGRYGSEVLYSASWMPYDEAEKIIRECAREFLSEHNPAE